MNPQRFLAEVTEYRARNYTDAVRRMLVGKVQGNGDMVAEARADLEETVNETVGMAQIIGARTALREIAVAMRGVQMSEAGRRRMLAFSNEQTIVPRVTFEEALGDMVDRTPVTLRNAAERTAQAISKLYSERTAVAFVKATNQAVTERAQGIIAEALRTGIGEVQAGRLLASSSEILQMAPGWSESYSRMAFRTNVNTAVTAGRFRQARDPDVQAVTPAFRFDSVGDSDTRPNHFAADGLIMSTRNPEWARLAPPLGYSCRCQASLVGVPELRRRGLYRNGQVVEGRPRPGAGPDEGFRHGGRPDLFLAGL